jgi:hypothetical protein
MLSFVGTSLVGMGAMVEANAYQGNAYATTAILEMTVLLSAILHVHHAQDLIISSALSVLTLQKSLQVQHALVDQTT